MPRIVSLILFIVIGTAVMAGVHYYLWKRLVHRLQLPPFWHRISSWILLLLFINLPVSMVMRRVLPAQLAEVWLVPSLTWIGVVWLALVAVFLVDILHGLSWLWRSLVSSPLDPSRRHALSRLLGLAATALTGGGSAVALLGGSGFQLKRVEVELERLPRALDGLTIAQITDVHVGPTIGREFVEQVVQQVNSLDVDLVAITGDLVDAPVSELQDAVGPLGQLSSRFGTFFVTGNHEYYSGALDWCEHLGSLGIKVLRNERVAIEKNGAKLELAGVDDFHASRFGHGHGPNLRRALAGRDMATPVVLMAHQPRAAHEANRMDVDLQISGHTHGGQLWPFKWLVRLQQPVVSGLERVGRTLVYVSNGTGYWGPPMRLAAPAEITHIVLRATA